MKNFWLDRRPKIIQFMDPYSPDLFQKWYICKHNPNAVAFMGFSSQSLFLHRDGVWRTTTYHSDSDKYSGYYDSWEDAYDMLMKGN